MSRHDQPNDQNKSSEYRQSKPTGSLGKSEPVFIAVGFLRRAHGVNGEMIMDPMTDFPERLRNRKVYLGDEHASNRLQSVRQHGKSFLVRIEGCSSPEDAAAFRNTVVYVKAEQLPPLPDGEYYHHQILGLNIVDEAGEVLGVLEQILDTKANDVYLVRKTDGGELLLPVVEEVILAYDLERGQIIVRPQEWA